MAAVLAEVDMLGVARSRPAFGGGCLCDGRDLGQRGCDHQSARPPAGQLVSIMDELHKVAVPAAWPVGVGVEDVGEGTRRGVNPWGYSPVGVCLPSASLPILTDGADSAASLLFANSTSGSRVTFEGLPDRYPRYPPSVRQPAITAEQI